MPQHEHSNNSKEKSIAEIEAEIQKIHKKVIQQTDDVKTLLKDKTKKKQISTNLHQTKLSLEEETSKYTLEEAQAEFFASIATLNSLISSYKEGRLDPQLYHQQFKRLLLEISKFKTILEVKGFNPVDFIHGENIQKKFDLAYQILKKEEILS